MNRTVGAERRDRDNELEKLRTRRRHLSLNALYGVRDSPARIDRKIERSQKREMTRAARNGQATPSRYRGAYPSRVSLAGFHAGQALSEMLVIP